MVLLPQQLTHDVQLKILDTGGFGVEAENDGVEPVADLLPVMVRDGGKDGLLPLVRFLGAGLQAPGVIDMYLKVLIVGIDELFDLHLCDRGAYPHFLHFPAEYVIEQGAFADPGFSYDQYIGRLFIHGSSYLTSVVSDTS